jgi:hypothetical protein
MGQRTLFVDACAKCAVIWLPGSAWHSEGGYSSTAKGWYGGTCCGGSVYWLRRKVRSCGGGGGIKASEKKT